MIAQLRYDHPHAKLSRICDLIDWPALRRVNETYEQFHARHFGPMEPLP